MAIPKAAAWSWLLTAAALFPSPCLVAQEDVNRDALIRSVFSYMIIAHICRETPFGADEYQSAYEIAERTIEILSESDEVPLQVDQMDEYLKGDHATAEPPALELCQEAINENLTAIAIERAKLGKY